MISIKHEDFSRNYDLFTKLCEITSEPIKLVKEGSPDLIIMNADAYERRKKLLDLREKLLRINEDTSFDSKGISIEELGKYIAEIENENKENTLWWKFDETVKIFLTSRIFCSIILLLKDKGVVFQ